VAVDVSHTALQRAAADALYRGLERHAVSPTARSTRSHIDRLVKNALLGDGRHSRCITGRCRGAPNRSDASLPTTTLGGGLTSDGPAGGWITVT
jgi:hypothetical protein